MAIAIQIFLKPNKKRKKKNHNNYNYKSNNKNQYNRKKTTNTNQGYKGFYKQKTSYTEKQKKGEEYEKYISQYFKTKGWISYEHGAEKGWKDQGIDLMLKKDNQFLFVQCKNWNKNHKYKMGIKKIQQYREKTKKYMLNNPQFSKILIDLYQVKLVFISSEDIYTKEAKTYIQENKNILEYQIIPMKNF